MPTTPTPTPTPASTSASAFPQSPTSTSPLAPPPHHLTWTEEKEERLLYVRRQLGEAQRRWSEEQELWIDEVHHLEDLKRACLKAEKKAKGRANSVAMIWKAKTWGSKAKDIGTGLGVEDEGDGEGDVVEGGCERGDGELPGTPTTRTSPLSTLFRTISLNKQRRNTLDGGSTSRPSLPGMPDGSFDGRGGR
ncbi:MAG: hypothetical protein Q9180_007876 [Flavoplaca navasiana]